MSVIRGAQLTLGNILDRLAGIWPNRMLVTELGSEEASLTYAEAAERCVRWSGTLRRTVHQGDRIVIALPNGYSLFLASMAVARAGGIAVPVNSRMAPAEIDHVIEDSQAKLIIRDEEELEGDQECPAVAAAPDDIAAILYSSGTTGRPLGAELTNRSLTGSLRLSVLNPGRGGGGEAVTGLPVAHISGFSMLLILAGLGIPVYLLRKFNPIHALDAIERRRATMFIGVPAMYRMMLDAGADHRDLRSVYLWASGADVMPDDLAEHFRALGGGPRIPLLRRTMGAATFIDGYGMVESAGVAALRVTLPVPGSWRPRPLLVARPGYRLRVLGDDGALAGCGQVGELVLKGRGVMRGYHADHDATAEVMTDDGWLRTGDLVRRGRLGVVELVGRRKDVIKNGGYSVHAAEVERCLEDHPDILEAAVVGLHDEQKGQIPVAALRLRVGANLDEEDLHAWLRSRMSDYKIPKMFRFVDDLPRNGTDKVVKSEVIALFASAAS